MAGLAFALSLQGCTNGSSHDKVAEAWSPDGRVVASLYEDNGGATTSFGYEVTLREKSSLEQKSAARLYGALRNPGAYGVDLKWSNSSTLQLECLRLKATPKLLTPVHLDGRDVDVRLRTGVEDITAPSGGMAFNLKRSAH